MIQISLSIVSKTILFFTTFPKTNCDSLLYLEKTSNKKCFIVMSIKELMFMILEHMGIAFL